MSVRAHKAVTVQPVQRRGIWGQQLRVKPFPSDRQYQGQCSQITLLYCFQGNDLASRWRLNYFSAILKVVGKTTELVIDL